MQSRYLWSFGGLCVCTPALVYLIPHLFGGSIRPDSIGSFDSWQPSRSVIQAAVGTGGAGDFRDSRHQDFARMFQQRFRTNQKAVGISFVSNDKMKAKFAATIPRWDMVSVALDLRDEAAQIFGKSFQVDIYETYISMTPVKLAEVREPASGGPVQVRFDRTFAVESDATALNEQHVNQAVFIPQLIASYYPSPAGWFVQWYMDPERRREEQERRSKRMAAMHRAMVNRAALGTPN